MKMRALLIPGAWAVLCAVVAAASLLEPGFQQSPPQFSVAAELVVLNVAVRDRRGGYLADLSEKAFSVLEDGKPRPIDFFSREDTPATVGLLVDNSGSMQPNLDRVLAATRAFADSSNVEDELFVLAFNERVRSALPASQPFTNQSRVLRDALADVLHARGRTALFDAIAEGLTYLKRGQKPRGVLVLLSDGGDNASTITLQEAMSRTQASNAVVYAVSLVDPQDDDNNPKLLRTIAEATASLQKTATRSGTRSSESRVIFAAPTPSASRRLR
jgi:VWFA-related protein